MIIKGFVGMRRKCDCRRQWKKLYF